MFNVVISGANTANAILIRALEPIDGIDTMRERRGNVSLRNLCNGPAKLTAALGITRKLNGIDLTRGNKIWIVPRGAPAPKIATGTRIGVDYAGADAKLPWRFVIAGNPFVSRPV